MDISLLIEFVKASFFIGVSLSIVFILGLVVGMTVMWVVRPGEGRQ